MIGELQLLMNAAMMNPSTGDESNILLWVIIGVLAFVLILTMIILKIKNKK